MKRAEINKLFKEKLGLEVKRVKDTSKGCDQEVKIVTTNKGKFALKIPKEEKDKVVKEQLACTLAKEVGIPCPEVEYTDSDLIIQTALPGKDLGDSKLTKKQYEEIYFQIGQYARALHTIKRHGYGAIQETGRGQSKTERKYVEGYLLPNIKKMKVIWGKEIGKKIDSYYRRTNKYLDTDSPVLRHADIFDDNIMVNKGEISGFIDFADIAAGSPMEDLSTMYIPHHKTYKFKKLLEGYGPHDIEKIKFYAFLRLTWMLAWEGRGPDTKQGKKLIKVYKEIIGC